ncbi:hypothetical protein E2562_002988 [Oryza meyeriana var. granulata]|uniref:RRM domain-containing protein n=1 Tax=Oryza meyeriana var. granulata TaxID=110450 RepID=A0A6G1DDN3_9ORYZ|nr:hypothetical protein E2562_002988 [Oryza meyeriana var. granulata]
MRRGRAAHTSTAETAKTPVLTGPPGPVVPFTFSKTAGPTCHPKARAGGGCVCRVSVRSAESELRAHFSQFGKVAYIGTPKNKLTGASRGFAFVQFVSPDAAARGP